MDDDSTESQLQITEALPVSQETISKRLRTIGKINKLDKIENTRKNGFVKAEIIMFFMAWYS